MSTYLTEALEGRTEAEWAAVAERRAKEEAAADVLDMIGEGHAQAYADGQITQQAFVRKLVDAAKKSGLGKLARAKIVGYWLLEAEEKPLKTITRRGPKGAPAWHRRIAVQGIPYAVQHGAVISREGSRDKPSAFVWVADYLTQKGLHTTAAQVEEWYRRQNQG